MREIEVEQRERYEQLQTKLLRDQAQELQSAEEDLREHINLKNNFVLMLFFTVYSFM